MHWRRDIAERGLSAWFALFVVGINLALIAVLIFALMLVWSGDAAP